MAKILVVDDDDKLRASLVRWLRKEGNVTEDAATGGDALQMLRVYKFDVIVLDWNLPDTSGIDVLNKYRAEGGITPVIFLTGKGDVESKREGLDAGADDYLAKPFHGDELAARIRALLRRPQGLLPTVISVGNVSIDLATKRVMVDGKQVKLGKKEYAILELLMRHPNQYFGSKELMESVWPSDADTTDDSVRSCMRQLRLKITSESGECVISSSQGAGYVIASSD